MGKAIFITGTDTDLGKTVITGCIASAIMRTGKKVAVYKPVQCGGILEGDIISPDLNLVYELSNIDKMNLFSDYSFKLAASPHLAAEKENKKIDVELIKNHSESLKKMYDVVLIEGAGGLIVPLTRKYTVLDLIKELDAPVLVISRAGLGTINHTSMTLKLLQEKKVKIIGTILNYFKGGEIEEDNKDIIRTLNNVEVLGTVPYSDKLLDIANNFEKYVDVNNFI
jgi:dethiobiotin synthetase